MTSPPSRTKRALLGCVVVPLVTAICLEIGARAIDRVRGAPWDAEAARARVEDALLKLRRSWATPGDQEAKDQELVLADPVIVQPYTAWAHARTLVEIADDARYYATAEAGANYDVCVLGGSVAELFGRMGSKALTEALQRDPRFRERTVRVHDYALAGYKEPQQAAMLAYLFESGHKPDAVVNLDGFNEAALGWENAKLGTNPLFPHIPHWSAAGTTLRSEGDLLEYLYTVRTRQDRARAFGAWFLGSGLWKSCFLDHAGTIVLQRLRRGYEHSYGALVDQIAKGSKDPALRGPPFDPSEGGVRKAILDSWIEGSTNLQGMCAQRGIPYLHVLQPTLEDTGSKTPTAKEIEASRLEPAWIDAIHDLYPRFREARKELESRGIRFLDASAIFRDHPEDLYYDGCHFGQRGNDILGEAIGAELARIDRR
jgi:hypothetical protein